MRPAAFALLVLLVPLAAAYPERVEGHRFFGVATPFSSDRADDWFGGTPYCADVLTRFRYELRVLDDAPAVLVLDADGAPARGAESDWAAPGKTATVRTEDRDACETFRVRGSLVLTPVRYEVRAYEDQ